MTDKVPDPRRLTRYYAPLPRQYPPSRGGVDAKRTIVEQHYDEFVSYTAAMVERTADPEAILRRLTRGNVQHRPTKVWPNWATQSK
jgi:TnpA family transposase